MSSRSVAIRAGLIRSALIGIPVWLLALLWASLRGGSGERVATVALINVVIVVGIQLFAGNSGVMSFGHVSFAAMGAYGVAILAAPTLLKKARIPDAPFGLATVQVDPWLGGLVAVGVVVLIAVLVGLAVMRLSGTAATIVTLALLVVTNSVLNAWTQLTGGAEAFYGIPTTTTLNIAAVVMFVAIAVAGAFRSSAAGLQLQASREDELVASAMGINVASVRLLAFVLSAMIVGAGGVLLALFLGAITPKDFYLSLTFTTIAMLVLGGKRSVTGAVAGVVFVTLGDELFRWLGDGPRVAGVDLPQLPGVTNLFLGLVILFGMIVRPAGFFGDHEIDHLIIPRLRRKREGRQSEQSAAPAPLAGRAGGTVLHAEQLEKQFGGVLAVSGVSLDIRSGEIVGLIGPNGAGKTTVLNLLSGVLTPTAGRVQIGTDELPTVLHEVARRGITRTFQNIRLFGELTVAENVAVSTSVALAHRDHERVPDADELLSRFRLAHLAPRRANTLAYGDQRRLEIVRAAALAPDIVLLDEPVAGMNEIESAELRETIRALRDFLGCGILVVDHDLSFILGLCHRIYVVDAGQLIATGSPDEIRSDPAVISAYIGSARVRHEPLPNNEQA